MKITEILTESQLQEGPLLNKIGSAVGKGVGALAKGAGAVAGGIAGIGKAFKKGYAAGKGTVGSGGDDDSSAAPTSSGGSTGSTAAGSTGSAGSGSASGGATAAPAQAAQQPGATKTPTDKTAAPQTKATPAASKQPKPSAAPAADPQDRIEPTMTSTAAAANDTQYAQAQKAIAALQPADQKQILAALQADPKVQAKMNKPAAQTTVKPAATPTPPAATPASSAEQPAVKKKGGRKKAAAPSQAEIDADRARIMGPTSDSIIRKGNSIVESIDEAGLMAKLGAKVGQAAQAAGTVVGKNVGAAQDVANDPEHAKNLIRAFKTGDTSKDPNSAPPIEDKSGTVPKPIIEKINQLNLQQRAELHKLISQKTV
jgi:hypothetical protein